MKFPAVASLLALTFATAACDTAALPSDDTLTFRSNGDLTIHRTSADADDPIDVVWDFTDGDVRSHSGELLITIDELTFFGANGQPRCSVVSVDEGSQILEDLNTGDILYTIVEGDVFDGEVDVHDPDFSQLAYIFDADEMLRAEDDKALVVGDSSLENGSGMRKLAIASLADGQCGTPGL